MPHFVNINGGWRNGSALSTNVNGAWRSSTQGFVNINGQWRSWGGYSLNDLSHIELRGASWGRTFYGLNGFQASEFSGIYVCLVMKDGNAYIPHRTGADIYDPAVNATKTSKFPWTINFTYSLISAGIDFFDATCNITFTGWGSSVTADISYPIDVPVSSNNITSSPPDYDFVLKVNYLGAGVVGFFGLPSDFTVSDGSQTIIVPWGV